MWICDNLSEGENGRLTFAQKDTVLLAEKYGTPLMLIDEEMIRRRCRTYKTAMENSFENGALPLFASKALCFKALYRIMKEEKMGIDIVSPGELYTALKAGFPLENAYFHGNNKTDEDIRFAIGERIGYFICDNPGELSEVDKEAEKQGVKQKVLLRLTPGIDPHTHKAISTGKVDSKFGSAIETGQARDFVKKALSLENIELMGFHCHIGSQIFEYKPFCDAAKIMLKFIADMKNEFGYEAKELNLGGGMGVRYTESQPQIDYAANIGGIGKILKELCAEYGVEMPKILMEPGRSIVADSGLTLYTVGGIKKIPGFKNYVSIDGGMTDNPRYALYQSDYTVKIANRPSESPDGNYTVAGRCCESGDLIQENVPLPAPKKGDILAVFTTGAYNYSMASNYNRIPRPPIVMISGGEEKIAVKRESFEDMIRNEI